MTTNGTTTPAFTKAIRYDHITNFGVVGFGQMGVGNPLDDGSAGMVSAQTIAMDSANPKEA